MLKNYILFLVVIIHCTNSFADCGLSGSIQQRIANCHQSQKVGLYEWKQVSSSVTNKAWLDVTTGFVWFDKLFGSSDGSAEDHNYAINLCSTIQGPFGLDALELPTIRDYGDADMHGLKIILSNYGISSGDGNSPYIYWQRIRVQTGVVELVYIGVMEA